MSDKRQWYQDVDTLTKVAAAIVLVLLIGGIQCFGTRFFQ